MLKIYASTNCNKTMSSARYNATSVPYVVVTLYHHLFQEMKVKNTRYKSVNSLVWSALYIANKKEGCAKHPKFLVLQILPPI